MDDHSENQSEDWSEDEFEKYLASRPESKLELLDGRLIVGNCLDGSRWLWREILDGLGAEAAVALGSFDQWVEALCQAYGFSRPETDSLELLEEQAASIEFQAPDLSRAGEGKEYGHYWVRSFLDYDGRIQICGRDGIRNLTGMLAMSFGLIEACRLIHPLDLVSALKSRRSRVVRDQEIRNEWRRKAREIAALLREKYGAKKVAVLGDLLDPKPLNYWSELTLVAWDTNRQTSHNIYSDVMAYEDQDTPDITVEDGNGRYFKEHLATSAEIVEL